MDSSRSILRAAALLCSLPALTYAGAISFGVWHEFSFANAGSQARGCDPADPVGAFCAPSSGTPTSFLDAPPWTFTSALPMVLTVTDAFTSGDTFEVFNFGSSIGTTSAPGAASDCFDDPVTCIADPSISKLSLGLAPGSYSLTLTALLSPDGGGAGYLIVSEVPEPSTALLIGAGCLALGFLRMRGARPKQTNQ